MGSDVLAARRCAVEVGGHRLELAYAEVPPEEAGRGPRGTVLYLHGFIASRRHWRPVIPYLRRLGWRQLAVDLPGFGDSEMLPRPHRLEDYADAVAAFLQAAGIRPAVVGHSMGGMVAVDLAYRYPEAAAALVLVAPAGLPHPHHRIPAWVRVPLVAPLLTRLVLWPPVARWYFRSTFARLGRFPPLWVEDLRYGVLRCREIRRMRRFYAMPHFLEALARIRVPVGVIWGEQDRVVPASDLEAIAAARGGQVFRRILPGVGHSPMHEAPEEFARALASLLDRLCPQEPLPGAAPAPPGGPEVAPRG